MKFDRRFLDKSWHWLRDADTRTLVMVSEFTREQQLQWFEGLPQRSDYHIWGICCDGAPIGAAGLKHVTSDSAEYWGYIGEEQFRGKGLGRRILGFVTDRARSLGLRSIYLRVHPDNARAIQLYSNAGFTRSNGSGEVIHMHLGLRPDAAPGLDCLSVVRYTPALKSQWNAFLRTAKNASFLFDRDYMEYHQDRFKDHSLMVLRGGRPTALLPANVGPEGALISHEGLTYGGLVVEESATLPEVLACFHALLRHLHQQAVPSLFYKRIPDFYNVLPADETSYALFLLDARLYRRDCSVVIPLGRGRLPFQQRRCRQIKRAAQCNVRFVRESVFLPFWQRVLEPRLKARYGVKPVHTVEEITLLASRFPDNIKQFSAYCDGDIVAGITIYETPTVAHAQYIGVTDQGRKTGALDGLVAWLLEQQYTGKLYFDLGICNEQQGRSLNHGLLEWKEGFGGRSCAHDFYQIKPENYLKLESVLATGRPDNLNKGSQPG